MLGRKCKLIHFSDGTIHLEGIINHTPGAGMLAERGEYAIINAPPTGATLKGREVQTPAALMTVKRTGPWKNFGGNREAEVQVVVSLDRVDQWQTRWLRPDGTYLPPEERPGKRAAKRRSDGPADVIPGDVIPGARVVNLLDKPRRQA